MTKAIIPFPRSRRVVVDYLEGARHKHHIHGLLELDVTEPRHRIRTIANESGTSLSFTAFIAACVGKAVTENPMLHAILDWRQRLHLYDDVDINIIIERKVRGKKMGTPHVIRATHRKSVAEIHKEIRAAQTAHFGMAKVASGWKAYRHLPGPARRAIYQTMARLPHIRQRYAGTVMLTSVGMFGDGGWGIPLTDHTLAITVGGITNRPWVVDGHIAIREVLNMTISVDHDIVDGAPAARFSRTLKTLVECGYGLPVGNDP